MVENYQEIAKTAYFFDGKMDSLACLIFKISATSTAAPW